MGTWGTGPFDDDTVMDFVDALLDRRADGVQGRLEEAVRQAVDAEGHLGFAVGVRAVAAAVLLAGVPAGGSPEVSAWRESLVLELTPDLAVEALRAIERAHSSGSELYELWAETGEYHAVWASLEPAMQALRRFSEPDQESLF
jgi:hypothetical protein